MAAASSVLAAAGGGTAEAIERIVEARESPTTPCFFAVASPKPSKQSNALSRPELHPPLLASSCRKATPLPVEQGKLLWQPPHLYSSRPKLVQPRPWWPDLNRPLLACSCRKATPLPFEQDKQLFSSRLVCTHHGRSGCSRGRRGQTGIDRFLPLPVGKLLRFPMSKIRGLGHRLLGNRRSRK